jgi:hypothetical protein
MTNNNLFGSDYLKNLTLQQVKDRFDNQRYNSNEGRSVQIDGVVEQVIIQNHKNPMNEMREDRYLHCALESLVHRGSIVEDGIDIYLVIADVDTNEAYKSTKILRCNNTLTLQYDTVESITGHDAMGRPIMDKTPLYVGYPCVVTSSLNVNRRSNINEAVNLPFGRLIVTIPANEYVKMDLNFEMYENTYKIIDIDKSQAGIINLMADKIV